MPCETEVAVATVALINIDSGTTLEVSEKATDVSGMVNIRMKHLPEGNYGIFIKIRWEQEAIRDATIRVFSH